MNASVETTGAQTLRRGLAVLKLLMRVGPGGLRVSEIGRRLALSKATAVRLTRTLLDEKFVVHDSATRTYCLGPEAFAVGLAAEPSYTLQRRAAPHLRALALETGEAFFFSVPNGLEIICLSRESGDIPIPRAAIKVGDRNPLGIGAAGVAMLAAMPDAEIETTLTANASVIQREYPNCPLPVVRELLAQTRGCGYSVIPGLIVKGYWALGVALCNPQGRPEGSISLVTSAARLPPSRQAALGGRLLRLASDLMGYAGAAPAKPL
jgi:DNA-binding IclR family transcriptional regulator